MSTPRPLWSTGQAAAQRFNRAYPGLQGGRRAGLAPVRPRLTHRRRRAAAAEILDWVQPADVEVEVFSTPLRSHITGTGEVDAGVWAQWTDVFFGTPPASVNTDPGYLGSAQVVGDVYTLDCYCRYADFMDLNCPPVSPPPPSGMSVVYEAPQGYIVSAVVEGGVNPETDGGYVVQLADAHTGWPTPTDLAAGTVLASAPQGGAYTPFAEGYTPGVGSRDVGVFAGAHTLHYNNTAPAPVTDPFQLRDTWAFTSISCTYTYRPPRYRFV